MLEEYKIDTLENHIICLIKNKRVLLDTGASTSLSDGSHLSLLGETYNFPTSYKGLLIDNFCNLLGTQINILLGMDVLKNLNFLVNWDKKIMIFSSAPFRLDGILVELELSMNIPTLSLLIDGTKVKVVLDTGSKLSYLEKHFTANRISLGKASDFSPGFGLFETDTFEVPVTLANQTFSMKVGHLPKLLQQTLQTSQAQGILGNEIFQYFHVCFNFQDKKLFLLTK